MALSPLEYERLEALLSGRALTVEEKISTLNMLRSKFPDVLSTQTFKNLTEANLKDNNFLIRFLANPQNRKELKKTLRETELYKSLSSNQRLELEQSLAEEIPQVVPPGAEQSGGEAAAEQPTAASVSGETGGTNIPGGLPQTSTSSASSGRIVHNVPQVQETPESKILIANKSGVVAEKPPTEFHVTDKAGNIQATYSKEPIPAAAQPKLILADSSGIIREGPGDASKLVSARGDGSIIEPKTPTPKIAIADSRGNVVREHTIPNQGRINFSALRSKVGGRIAGSANSLLERVNPAMKKFGDGMLRNVEGMTNLGGGGRIGSRSIFGRFSRFGRGRPSITQTDNKKKARWGLRTAIGLLAMMLLTGLLAITSQPPSPSPSPSPGLTGSDISNCQFYRAGVNMKFQSPLLLSYIREAAQKSSIPAAVLASFIRVESPSASDMEDYQISNYATNCAVSPTGALGIMQIQPPGTTSLKGDPASCDDCIDTGARLIGKTVSTMTRDDYCNPRTSIIVGAGWILKKMQYLGMGDGARWNPAWTHDPDAIKTLVNTYYGCLDYGGPDDCTGPYNYATDVLTSIQECKNTTPSAVASCPVLDGHISTPSYNASPSSGHCGDSYQYNCKCETSGRRAKAIDVPTNGQNVLLPKINSQDVTWKMIVGPYSVDSDEGGGAGYTFQTTQGGDTYYLDMLHLNQSGLFFGSDSVSGTPVATTTIGHVHMTIGKNLSRTPVAGSDTDCDPNWLPSDFMCQ